MNTTKTHYAVFGILTATLLLAGFGCSQEFKSDVDTAFEGGVAVPLQALNAAKGLNAEEQARLNRQAEEEANELTVAMVLTENMAIPTATKVGDAFGCSDKVALTKVARAAATDDVLHDALVSLFDVKDSSYNNLYNSLSQSTLTLEKIQSRDAVTTEVWLKGKIVSGGTCDDPRIKAQIENTIKYFRPKFQVFLNGSESEYRCLGDQSGECK